MQRIINIINQFNRLGIEGFLVTKTANVTYLSGFNGDSSYLFISQEMCLLITDERYTEQAEAECYNNIEVLNWIERERYGSKTFRFLADKYKIQIIGFESTGITFAEHKRYSDELSDINFIPIEDVIEEERKVKDEVEIGFLQKACAVSDLALELTIPFIKPGIKEIELTARLEYHLKTNGADDISFKSIVLSGSRTSLLHGSPNENVLKSGDFILFDFGAEVNGYHADISRTVVLGKADNQQRKIYGIVKSAQEEAANMMKEGNEGDAPDKVIRKIIPSDLLPYYYPGIGHGVGLEVHEKPFIKQHANFIYKSGMVITIEPGLYIPGWGGMRIEDTLLISGNTPELLTNFTRELIEI